MRPLSSSLALPRRAPKRTEADAPSHPPAAVEEQLRNAPNPLPSSALPGVDHISGQRAAIESHEADNPHYHYDLPPNSRASFAALAPPDDPQHMFHVSSDNAQLPSPSQLYIFGASSSSPL